MIYSYYPGCTLKTQAKELNIYAQKSAKALGFTLEELPEWQCCGGVYPLAKDEIATKLASVRALIAAKENKQTLVTLCAACHNVIKQVNADLKTDVTIANRVNAYLQLTEPYSGDTTVLHFLEVLRDEIGFEELAKKIVKPFTGKKIGAYYGCLLLRPGKVLQMDNPENPKIMEDFIRAIGGEPVLYSMRNECCGAYVTIEDAEFPKKRSRKILENASEFGADFLVTACPLCQYNLHKNAAEYNVPIYYFTELLAEALGVKE